VKKVASSSLRASSVKSLMSSPTAIGRPEADDGLGREPVLVDDLAEHRLRVVVQLPRRLALLSSSRILQGNGP
jgi:hypothetical protein